MYEEEQDPMAQLGPGALQMQRPMALQMGPMNMQDVMYRADRVANPLMEAPDFDESSIEPTNASMRLSAAHQDAMMEMDAMEGLDGMEFGQDPLGDDMGGMQEPPFPDDSMPHEMAEGEADPSMGMDKPEIKNIAMDMLAQRAKARMGAAEHFQKQASKLKKGY